MDLRRPPSSTARPGDRRPDRPGRSGSDGSARRGRCAAPSRQRCRAAHAPGRRLRGRRRHRDQRRAGGRHARCVRDRWRCVLAGLGSRRARAGGAQWLRSRPWRGGSRGVPGPRPRCTAGPRSDHDHRPGRRSVMGCSARSMGAARPRRASRAGNRARQRRRSRVRRAHRIDRGGRGRGRRRVRAGLPAGRPSLAARRVVAAACPCPDAGDACDGGLGRVLRR